MIDETPNKVLVIACGALVREISDLKERYGWDHLELKCIDAKLHNRPALIPDRLRKTIRRYKDLYAQIFVAYADCGTGGGIDQVIDAEGIRRLPGAHCYQFFAGGKKFEKLMEADPGTFYLTDFLVQHFDQFVTRPLKLIEHPELRDEYFGNYGRLAYLSQTHNEVLVAAARQVAKQLDLRFEHVHCGYGELETSLESVMASRKNGQKDTYILA